MPPSIAFAAIAFVLVCAGAVGLYIVDQAVARGGRLAAGERVPLAIGIVAVAICLGGLHLAARLLV